MANRVFKDFPELMLGHDEYENLVDFDEVFGRKAPLHIEIGAGKGTFIFNQAKAFPEINFLGIEWANKYCRYAADRLGRWGIPNVRMMRTDAACYITEHVPDSSIECYHIYFPDPWHKKRHNKRRLICDENVKQFYRTLAPNGILNIATDHQEYYNWMCKVFSGFTDIFDKVDFVIGAGAREGEMVGTNFERKYILEGRQTYTIALQKK